MVKGYDRMFAMLGQRAKNGRIKKNEKYLLDEFVWKTFPEYFRTQYTDVSWYNRLFKTKKYKHARLIDKLLFYEELKIQFKNNLIRLIKEDEIGRKKR